MDINPYVLVGFILRVVGLGLLVVFVIPQQIREVKRPRNEFTPLRKLLLVFAVAYSTLSALILAYILTRLTTDATYSLQNVASVFGGLTSLFMCVLLTLIYRFKGSSK